MTLRSLAATLMFVLAFGGSAAAVIAAVRRLDRWSAVRDLERRRRSRTLLLSEHGEATMAVYTIRDPATYAATACSRRTRMASR